eukprot:5366980-Prymnesium_polylepis.1
MNDFSRDCLEIVGSWPRFAESCPPSEREAGFEIFPPPPISPLSGTAASFEPDGETLASIAMIFERPVGEPEPYTAPS